MLFHAPQDSIESNGQVAHAGIFFFRVLQIKQGFAGEQAEEGETYIRARHRYEQVGSVVHRVRPLAHHMVEPQVQLVVRQVLLGLA